MSIGQLAKAAGVGVETVRFYEREGLLAKPPRGLRGTGIRRYPGAALDRLRLIRRAKDFGFTLEDIRTLLSAAESKGHCGEIHRVARARLGELEERMQQLSRARDALREAVVSCEREGDVASCGIVRALTRDSDSDPPPGDAPPRKDH
jgi:MerR family transcriptional regulator, copper efflux regulator